MEGAKSPRNQSNACSGLTTAVVTPAAWIEFNIPSHSDRTHSDQNRIGPNRSSVIGTYRDLTKNPAKQQENFRKSPSKIAVKRIRPSSAFSQKLTGIQAQLFPFACFLPFWQRSLTSRPTVETWKTCWKSESIGPKGASNEGLPSASCCPLPFGVKRRLLARKRES
jgi:hypothetical protein